MIEADTDGSMSNSRGKCVDLVTPCHFQGSRGGWMPMGDRFDLKEFHGVVLGNGMVPLEILEQLVDDFIRKGLDL
jgi:hypothetical protein